MRLTNVLNIGLLALVLVASLGGALTWVGISTLRGHLEIAHVTEAITGETDGLNEALKQFQQAQNEQSGKEVRRRIELVNRAIDELTATGAPRGIIDDLQSAKQNYASAFDAYVKHGSIKDNALETVNDAAISLKDRATSEARHIARENARAFDHAEEIERRQSQAFLAAQRVTEILVAISRMRQAADVLVQTGDQGPERTITTALDRIRANLGDVEGLGEAIIDKRRLVVFRRWLNIYSTLTARAATVGRDVDEVAALQTRLHRTSTPLQTEADRLRDAIQATLRSAISDANDERDRLFEVSRRNSHLGHMHQTLSDVLMKVQLLKAKAGGAPEDLAKNMTVAVAKLKQSADALFPQGYRSESTGSRHDRAVPDGRNAEDGVAGIAAAIMDLEDAWQAAIVAAVEQEARSHDMSEAASDAEAVIKVARRQVEETLEDVIGDFLVFISIAIALGILTSVLGAAYIYRQLTRPFAALTKAITLLAKGDLKVPVPQFQTSVELTELAEAAEVLRRSSLERIQLERENARKERRIANEQAEAEKLELSLRKEQEKMQLQRKFVAMVSHEFRTPLAIIDGQAQGVLRRLDRIQPESLASRMTKVQTAVERLVTMMETMLSSSRLEAGTIEFRPEEHDLQELVAEVCAHQHEVSASHDIVVDVDALPKRYHGDPRLLRQVFANLLSNAVKYSPDAKQVDVTVVEDAHGLQILIRDYGLGIPENELPKLSSQFFRASTSEGISGTGIGLHLVKAFIDMHGGSMTISSIVGEGSTFSIQLPSIAKQLAA